MTDAKEQVANIRAREYIQQVLDQLGTDATNLARRAKLNPSTLTGFMRREPRVRSIRPATLEAIARASEIPLPADLANLAGQTLATRQDGGMPRDVPIHALIQARIRDTYYWNTTAADFAPRPPGISQNRRVFALRMPDASMDGWRRVNELLFLDPMRAVGEGDHAMVELANTISPNDHSVYMIRRVIRRRPSGVVLGTWGLDPTETEMKRTDVLSFLRVLEWSEVVGI